ncbi:MAG: hypothetical protein COW59_11530 [Lysobacterales bacterium CG17_big_fil_post_rev_8_21_14_2_50_64_11]|nr:MAG: hypothetical protein COW59_11530 [Xanthomonadales bacterium CG17_big_fil_post_rev_8_21_14_2_50_64_11]
MTEHAERISASEVAAWLRRHPDFLATYPDLALTLAPPRQEGSATSLASYQLDVLRDKNRELNRRLHELFATAQDNERLAVRTHQLALTLMRQRSAADTVRAMVASLGEDFHGDQVSVVLYHPVTGLGNEPWLQIIAADAAELAPFAQFVSDGEPLCGRLHSDKQQRLFGASHTQIQSSALMAIPERGLLAVGSRDANRFFPGMGTVFLRLMAQSLAAALARFDGA